MVLTKTLSRVVLSSQTQITSRKNTDELSWHMPFSVFPLTIIVLLDNTMSYAQKCSSMEISGLGCDSWTFPTIWCAAVAESCAIGFIARPDLRMLGV